MSSNGGAAAPGPLRPPVHVPVLLELVGAMIGLWVLSAGIGVWQTYLTATVGNTVMGALRVRLFSHLQRMELAFFTRTQTGALLSRMNTDVVGAQNTVSTLATVLDSLFVVVVTLAAMMVLSWQVTLLALAVVPVFAVLDRNLVRLVDGHVVTDLLQCKGDGGSGYPATDHDRPHGTSLN